MENVSQWLQSLKIALVLCCKIESFINSKNFTTYNDDVANELYIYFRISCVPVNIGLTGTVVASAWTISTSLNINVPLDDAIQPSTLQTVGSVSSSVGFMGFTAGTSSVKVVFNGAADPDYLTHYKNSGPANVAVELIEKSTGFIKGSGKNMTWNVDYNRIVLFQ